MESEMIHPEEINFEHNGLRCKCRKVKLTRRYWWCGYVNIPKDHQWYGLDYDSDKLRETPAPGGLTFSGRLGDKDSWWIGFDTAHSGDIWPGNETGAEELNLSWARCWIIDDLIEETKKLADRANEAKDGK